MSLLDDVSIVVTPNGYKAGELYAVKPTFALGSEEVSNGDLSNGTVGFTPFNSTIANVSNTLQITNTASYGSAGADVLTTIVGRRYEFSADIKSGTSTTALMRAGITPNGIELLNVTAFSITSTFVKHTFYFVATSTTSYVSLWSGSATIGHTIFFDNISVKEYTSADMDVTRATAATRVDENGLVNYAEVVSDTELVTNGDFATDSDWTKGTGWTISGGTANANTSGNYINLYQNSVFTVGKAYKYEFTVSNYSQGDVRFTQSGVDISGLKSANGIYTGVFSASQTALYIQGVNSFIGSIDNVSVKEVTRDNVPRIDYTGGGCPHILAEPQRTNGIPYSEDLSQSTWIASNQTVSLSEVLSPNGTSFSYKLTATANYSKIREDLVLNATTTYTVSFYTKNISAANPRIVVYDQNNAVTLLSQSYGSELSSSEWVRITGTFTTTTAATIQLQICRDLMNSEEMLIWGTQLEEGSYATSYIPTSGSTVTRNQDIFTRDGIGSLINSTEGVLFVEMAALDDGSNFRMITLSDGTSTNIIYLYFLNTSNSVKALVVVNGVEQFSSTIVLSDRTQFGKYAVRWDANNYAFYTNGTLILKSTTGVTFPINTLTTLNLASESGISFPLEAKVKQLQVYDTSLSDTQLAALTS